MMSPVESDGTMEHHAGLDHAEQPDSEERAAQLRASPRDSMFVMAALRRPGGPEVAIKVRNLSAGGLMAEASSGFSRGEPIEVELRGIGAVGGRIAWTAGGRIGIAFENAIDPMLARRPVVAHSQPHLLKAARTHWRPSVR